MTLHRCCFRDPWFTTYKQTYLFISAMGLWLFLHPALCGLTGSDFALHRCHSDANHLTISYFNFTTSSSLPQGILCRSRKLAMHNKALSKAEPTKHQVFRTTFESTKRCLKSIKSKSQRMGLPDSTVTTPGEENSICLNLP